MKTQVVKKQAHFVEHMRQRHNYRHVVLAGMFDAASVFCVFLERR